MLFESFDKTLQIPDKNSKFDYWNNRKNEFSTELNQKQLTKTIYKKINEATDKFLENSFSQIHREISLKENLEIIWKEQMNKILN